MASENGEWKPIGRKKAATTLAGHNLSRGKGGRIALRQIPSLESLGWSWRRLCDS